MEGRFPRFRKRGPIEAREAVKGAAGGAFVSALPKARPH